MYDIPAFPAPEASVQHFGDSSVYMGMTLRDYFAGIALQTQQFLINPYNNTQAVASECYKMADAMLKARVVNGKT
jgi:hypothetical protein